MLARPLTRRFRGALPLVAAAMIVAAAPMPLGAPVHATAPVGRVELESQHPTGSQHPMGSQYPTASGARQGSGAGLVASSAGLVAIQGRIIALQPQQQMATVHTPDQRPVCTAGHVCPLYIVAGVSFRVDLSSAAMQAATGRSLAAPGQGRAQTAIASQLTVGEPVLVVGTFVSTVGTTPALLRAIIVERIVQPAAAATPTPGH